MSAESKMNILANARAQAVKESPARERLALLFDEGTFTELDAFVCTKGSAGVVIGCGAVEGTSVFAFSQDCTEANGAVGAVQAAKIKKVYDLAAKTGAPVVGIYDSFGASLAQQNEALAAYGEMLLWSNNISGVVPQVSVVAGTCAGSAALVAASADLLVMSKKAELFLTAAAAKGGTAENAAKAGVAQLLAEDDKDAVKKARRLVSMLPQNNLAALPVFDFSAKAGTEAALRAACENIDELDAAIVADAVCDADSVVELMDTFAARGAYTALATIGGFTCGIAATRGGALCASACDKLAKLVQLCDAFQIPVVTLVNAAGFVPEEAAEAKGLVRAAARLAHVYAEATTAKVAVVTGKAYGPAFIALAGRSANADVVYAWPSAVISALDPKAAVAILRPDDVTAGKTADDLAAEYAANEASPYKACENGSVDDVIDPANTRDMLLFALDMLSGKRVSRLPKKHSNLPL